ncbi:MAG: hypothetical protein ABIE07_08105 [Candidatus Zixiibacteriota bacterium]
MNKNQQRNLIETADAIGSHLALTWNYVATLRALQKHARSHPKLIEAHNHFIFTITQALWDVLLLKLSHCSDNTKKAKGFPKLFNQLKKYLPEGAALKKTIKKQEKVLQRLATLEKVKKWRNEIIAHHTYAADGPQFFEDNQVTLDEVGKLVTKHRDILHAFTFPLFDLGFRIKDHGPRAHRGVNKLFASLKESRTKQSRGT